VTLRKRRFLFYVSTLVFLIAAGPVILYTVGYRITWSTLSLQLTGGFFISTQPTNAIVTLDARRTETSSFLTGGLFIQNLTPTTYTVHVEKPGFWPWTKELTVQQQEVTEAHVMLTPKEPEGIMLAQGTEAKIMWAAITQPEKPLYVLEGNNLFLANKQGGAQEQLLETVAGFLVQSDNLIILDNQSGFLFKTNLMGRVPEPLSLAKLQGVDHVDIWESNDQYILVGNTTMWLLSSSHEEPEILARYQEKPRVIGGGAYIVWWSGQDAWIRWTVPEKDLPFYQTEFQEQIISSDHPISSIFPYPRHDYLIVASGNTVDVVELDGRGNIRNRAPLYKGKAPQVFVPSNERVAYILDDGALIKIELK